MESTRSSQQYPPYSPPQQEEAASGTDGKESPRRSSWYLEGRVWRNVATGLPGPLNQAGLTEKRRHSISDIKEKSVRPVSLSIHRYSLPVSVSAPGSRTSSRRPSIAEPSSPVTSQDFHISVTPATPTAIDSSFQLKLPEFAQPEDINPPTMRRGSIVSISSVDSDSELKTFLASEYSRRRASAPITVPKPAPVQPSFEPENEHHKDLPEVHGLINVANHKGQGIPISDLTGIQEAIKFRMAVVSIRPFSKLATQLKMAGARSKSLKYKLKSGGWGPHCASLPMKQKYSKKIGSAPEVIAKLQDYADQLKDEAVVLKMTEDRLDELTNTCFDDTDQRILENLKRNEDGTIEFTARPEGHLAGGSHEHKFRGTRESDGSYRIAIEEEGRFVDFEVIDLIPDYDLGFVFYHFDRINLSLGDKPRWAGRQKDQLTLYLEDKAQKRRGSSAGLGEAYYQNPEQLLGKLSLNEEEMLAPLNRAVGRGPDNKMFHHGPDNRNPGTELSDNFPLTVILSEKIGALEDTFYIIKDDIELTAFVQELKNNNYHAPVSDRWGQVTKVRSQTFTAYSRRLEQQDSRESTPARESTDRQ